MTARKGPPLNILDLGLPGKPGLAWLGQLAERRPKLARRTLVITGLHLAPSERRKIERLGAGLLGKPIPLKALVDSFVEPVIH